MAREEGTERSADNQTNPQKRRAGEKPRDKPVEEEADKDIKPGKQDASSRS